MRKPSLLKNVQIGSAFDKPLFREITAHEKDWLVSQLSHRKSRIRGMAACDLGKFQVKESVEPLISALQDQHWLVRLHSAQALGRLGDQKALEPLKQAVLDSCPFVRRRVIVALGKLGDESAVPLILKAVQADGNMWVYASDGLRNFMGFYASHNLLVASRLGKQSWHSSFLSYSLSFLTPILLLGMKISEGFFQLITIDLLGIFEDERASKDLEQLISKARNNKISISAFKSLGQIQCRHYEKYLPPKN